MKRHLTNTRNALGRLGVLAAKTEASERKILDSALRRHAEISVQIERSRIGVEGANTRAQDRYLRLIEERGQLEKVIAKARKALSMH